MLCLYLIETKATTDNKCINTITPYDMYGILSVPVFKTY